MRKVFWIIKKIFRRRSTSLDFLNDTEAYDKKNELEGMKIACDAIMILGKRYAAYARELAAKEEDAGAQEKSFFRLRPTVM